MTCVVDGCTAAVRNQLRGLCNKHYISFRKYGDPTASKTRRPNGAGSIRRGYLVRAQAGDYTAEHIRVAERALGKPLPPGAVVHHVDEDPLNNEPSNLVICPDQSYHILIHTRMRALDACGNAGWRKCPYCKEYDDPANMRSRPHRNAVQFRHLACVAQYNQRLLKAKGNPSSIR